MNVASKTLLNCVVDKVVLRYSHIISEICLTFTSTEFRKEFPVSVQYPVLSDSQVQLWSANISAKVSQRKC